MSDLKRKISKLGKTGFFSIFVSNIFSKVISFLGGIILVHIFTKNTYGVYAAVINAVTILYLLNDFGASTAALQFLTEAQKNKDKQQLILKFALKIGVIGSLFSGLLILLSPLFFPFKIEGAKYLTPLLCLEPFFTNITYFISSLLRANQENNKYAILEFSKTFFNYGFLIVGAIFFGLKGAIISRYFYIILSLIIGLILSSKLIKLTKNKKQLPKKEKKEFLNYSIITQLSSTLSGILLNIDLFLIGIIIATTTSIANYKVASTIPFALSFLPTCVTIYILPYFISHKDDKKWVKSNHRKLIKYGAIFYGFISIVLIVFAKPLFSIIYTSAYLDAVLPFQILIIGFFFSSTFVIPTNNIFASMRKVKINLIITIISAILNFFMNILFINCFGIVGAAITTTAISIISSLIQILYANKLLKIREEENNIN